MKDISNWAMGGGMAVVILAAWLLLQGPLAKLAADDALRQSQEDSRRSSAQLKARASQREAAWKAFYTKPAHCEDPGTSELLTQCADEQRRAKRQFDEAYPR
ncbi:MAG: hypothetical protein EOP36_01335 [Rubrivivax sp.]|nr:MAG: hypothetical protein EOP36_01335 [Rubrivivax sp.]